MRLFLVSVSSVFMCRKTDLLEKFWTKFRCGFGKMAIFRHEMGFFFGGNFHSNYEIETVDNELRNTLSNH